MGSPARPAVRSSAECATTAQLEYVENGFVAPRPVPQAKLIPHQHSNYTTARAATQYLDLCANSRATDDWLVLAAVVELLAVQFAAAHSADAATLTRAARSGVVGAVVPAVA